MADAVHTAERLKELQALPLDRKIQISQARIIEWYQRNKGNVVVSFSGGKDSTVLLHLVRSIYPDVPAVFSNTGLEYPEIFRFVQTFPNVEIVRPKMVFSEVISTYGYPLIGKEVAEAIYYARRIRSQSVQVERERERDAQRESYSDEPSGKPPYCADRCDAARHTHTHNGANEPNCAETDRRRNDLNGRWQTAGLQANRTGGGRTSNGKRLSREPNSTGNTSDEPG